MAVQTDLLQAGLEQPGEAGLGMRLVTLAGSVLDPDQVADTVIAGLADERFLILPHPEVQKMFSHKACYHDQWIDGMQRARGAAALHAR